MLSALLELLVFIFFDFLFSSSLSSSGSLLLLLLSFTFADVTLLPPVPVCLLRKKRLRRFCETRLFRPHRVRFTSNMPSSGFVSRIVVYDIAIAHHGMGMKRASSLAKSSSSIGCLVISYTERHCTVTRFSSTKISTGGPPRSSLLSYSLELRPKTAKYGGSPNKLVHNSNSSPPRAVLEAANITLAAEATEVASVLHVFALRKAFSKLESARVKCA